LKFSDLPTIVKKVGFVPFTRSCVRNNRVWKELGQHKEDAVLENLQFRNDVLVDSIEGDGSTLEYLMPQFLWQFILNERMPRLHKWNNWSTVGRPSLLLDSGISVL
jgi:hypothetical protein